MDQTVRKVIVSGNNAVRQWPFKSFTIIFLSPIWICRWLLNSQRWFFGQPFLSNLSKVGILNSSKKGELVMVAMSSWVWSLLRLVLRRSILVTWRLLKVSFFMLMMSIMFVDGGCYRLRALHSANSLRVFFNRSKISFILSFTVRSWAS